ncbi:putative sporulation transcription regulator WhiA [Lactococcus hodotermopsidis]|uniref:Probable cell division protein WhiA n=1 Tax=Pseudolactococcus hodotermopsidis TaxID=2709157 RepID=A0A6A0BDZ3_9LACT|nr:DNA-binding protein WhiA [Lactococcus hodotermopsidis]GFH42581.1 putative sporulation transcription regulator WhiA [Lactococcus hodotermopsidis]
MSFSSEVKNELTQLKVSDGVMIALLRMNGRLGISNGLSLAITTENATTAKFIYRSLSEVYDIKSEINTYQKTTLSKNRVYTLLILGEVSEVLDRFELADSLLLDNGVPIAVKFDKDLALGYLRGAFISSGSVTNPEKSKYHLEIASYYEEHATDLQRLLADFGIESKLIARKNRTITYLSNSELILSFLSLIGATKSRFKLENAKIFREIRNIANRQTNFETANIGKTVNAAQNAIEDIKLLQSQGKLPENLREIALARIANPDDTILELGQRLTPPLGKSGVNHRLRQLKALAATLRQIK